MTLFTAFVVTAASSGLLALMGTFVNNWLAKRIIGGIALCVVVAAGYGGLALMAFAYFARAHRLGLIILPAPGVHPVEAGLWVVAAGLVLSALGVLNAVMAVQHRRRRRGYARAGGA
jgi:hypothetical protein